MLPSGFEWKQLCRAEGPFVSMHLDGKEVARMCPCVGGGWVAALNQHLDWNAAARVSRPCSSWDSGRAGIEAWAARHADRIREEVRQWQLSRPRQPYMAAIASVKFEGAPSNGGGSTGSPP